MNPKEILLSIHGLGLYSDDEWEEYTSYFSDCEDLRRGSIKLGLGFNPLFDRVRTHKSTEAQKPNSDLSQKSTNADCLSSLASNATVGIVSGCYDLLHLGHLRGMKYAKQFLSQFTNPRLCVLTLSDENIRVKKGENRPVLNLDERLQMLCAVDCVDCVDCVVPLSEPNCLTVLDKVKPAYFFKAKADNLQGIVKKEIELVEANGGHVAFFQSSNGREISTTKLIETIRNIKARSEQQGFYLLGENVCLDERVVLLQKDKISIGDNVSVGMNTVINARRKVDEVNLLREGIFIGRDSRIGAFSTLESVGGYIIIGEGSSVKEYCLLYGASGIEIGNFVRIAPFVSIIAENHVIDDPHIPICQQGLSYKGIKIGDDVWVGTHCTILDGVKIGNGCVIGASSTVIKDIPEYSVAMGSPAVVKRRRV